MLLLLLLLLLVTGACSDATNVDNDSDMFDTQIDSIMSRVDIELIEFMDNYIIENGVVEDNAEYIFELDVHNPANTYDDGYDDDTENDSGDDYYDDYDDDDDNMENENYSADDEDDDNMDDNDYDDDDELISMVQYEY